MSLPAGGPLPPDRDAVLSPPPLPPMTGPMAGDAGTAVEIILTGWAGPALCFAPDGQVRAVNAAATRLLAGDPSWLDGLAGWIAAGALAETHSSPLPGEEVLEWMPLLLPGAGPVDGAAAAGGAAVAGGGAGGGGGGVVALGRVATLERRLRQALTESRQRYKDLVDISSDFAWETDADGRFVFVSPAGAIGYRADELVGRLAADFLLPDFDDGMSPFGTAVPIERVEVWLRDAVGKPACLVSSAVPLIGADGAPAGARGACRDITEVRLRAMELAQVRLREKYLGYIISSTRDDVDPLRTLNIAIGVTINATGADGAVLRACRDGRFVPAVGSAAGNDTGTGERGGGEGLPASLAGPLDALIQAAADSVEPQSATVTADGGAYEMLAARTLFRHEVNGAVAVWRQADGGWGEDERSMVTTIADHVGAALAQATYQDKLKTLSERDGLTGLYNRRTFMDLLEQRLGFRPAGGSALLYFDLDNFKAVNDLRGHAAGDDVLRAVGDLLRRMARGGDLAGRLGGDEFVLWVDRVDEGPALAVADRLLREAAEFLRPLSASPDKPLGVSVGVALHTGGSGEGAQGLVDRGDQGMYGAKRLGKGYRLLAPPYGGPVDGAAEGKDA